MNFPIVDFSTFSSVDLSDFSSAASMFLSEKITSETKKLLNRASDKMKSSKISSMIDELVEENLELKRIEETKFKILELIKVLLFTLKFDFGKLLSKIWAKPGLI